MRDIAVMVGKDLRLLLRDRMATFFTLFFPLAMAIFFGTMFGGGEERGSRGIRIAVVDEDRTPESRAFVSRLRQAPEFAVDSTSRAAAHEAVRLGNRTAFVVLPPGFGATRQRLFYGAPPEVELGLDPSRKAESGLIQGVLTKMLSERMQDLFAHPDALRRQNQQTLEALDTTRALPQVERGSITRFLGELDRFLVSRQQADSAADKAAPGGGTGWQPVAFRTSDVAHLQRGPRNAYQISFPQGVIWAIISSANSFALSLVLERTRGTLVRLRAAPMARGRILLGKAVGCLLTILAMSTVLLLIGALVFHVRPSSPPLLAVAVISAAIGFVGIMMLISVMGRSQRGVSGLGWAAMMMMSMTGGGMVPLFAMPAWMQSASVVSPVRWAIIAIEGGIWRDFTVAQMAVPCGVLLAIGIIGYTVGIRVFRWTET